MRNRTARGSKFVASETLRDATGASVRGRTPSVNDIISVFSSHTENIIPKLVDVGDLTAKFGKSHRRLKLLAGGVVARKFFPSSIGSKSSLSVHLVEF